MVRFIDSLNIDVRMELAPDAARAEEEEEKATPARAGVIKGGLSCRD